MFGFFTGYKSFLLEYQEQAFVNIFGSLKGKFTSPLRGDTNPGCFFWYSKDKILYFVDFADEPTHRNAIKFYQDMYGVSKREAMQIIKHGRTLPQQQIKEIRKHVKKKTSAIISIKKREWFDMDIDYWSRYKVDISDIDKYIIPVSRFTVNKKWTTYPLLAYAIPINKCVKIYMPKYKDQQKKFISNCRKSDVFALDTIDFDKPVYITKAFKDWIVLRKAGLDNVVVAQSETMGLPAELLPKINKAYILFDNDKAGITNANKLKSKLKDAKIILPSEKDFADMAVKYELNYIYSYIIKNQ